MASTDQNQNKNLIFHDFFSSKSQSEINQFLQINLSSLTSHFNSNSETIETLIFAVENHSKTNSWKHYQCPLCSQSFSQSISHSRHLTDDHITLKNKNLNFFIPKQAESTKVDSFMNENWDLSGLDSERSNFYNRIRVSVGKLIDSGVLADSVLNMMVKIAGVDDFRSLSVSKLMVIVTLLEGLVSECCENNGGVRLNEEDEMESIIVSGDGNMLELNAKIFGDVDALVSWLCNEKLLSENDVKFNWEKLKNDKKREGEGIFEKIRAECEQLEMICLRKHNCLKYRSAVVTLQKVFVELVEKTNQSQEAVMRKLRGDLANRQGNDNDLLRHVAANVTKEAETLKASKIRNLVKLVRREDSSTADAFTKQLLDTDFEETKCDTKLLRKTVDIKQLQDKLVHASALDYLEVVVPLVKFCLRKRLNDEAELVAALIS